MPLITLEFRPDKEEFRFEIPVKVIPEPSLRSKVIAATSVNAFATIGIERLALLTFGQIVESGMLSEFGLPGITSRMAVVDVAGIPHEEDTTQRNLF